MDKIKFKGTEQQFEAWKKRWRKDHGLCDKFHCIHELMACGIEYRCGSCSDYRFQHDIGCIKICDEVSCGDCVFRDKCKKFKGMEAKK